MSITFVEWMLGLVLILSSLGVILARHPVYSSLSFLLTLMTLATVYLQLSAEFMAVMQILVYAGAILVIFMFVIVLFQDAHDQLAHFRPKSSWPLIFISAGSLLALLFFFAMRLLALSSQPRETVNELGTAQALGKALYTDFFFPFEAVIFLFLIAVIGSLYIGRKVK
jgi:NADH-quinone oxidoreductase subunit J